MSDKLELKGKRVVLTRSYKEGDRLAQMLRRHGAELLPIPMIEVRPIDDPDHEEEVLSAIQTYEWIVFSSANGVRCFFEAFFRRYKDLRCFGPAKIACVGKQTAHEVSRFHLEVDLIPAEGNAQSMVRDLIATGSLPSVCVLWVSGDRINRPAVQELEKTGEAIVDTFVVYESSLVDLEKDAQARRFRDGGADLVLFASPSSVQSFSDQAAYLQPGAKARIPKTLSIGATTAEAMRKYGIPMDAQSSSPEPEVVLETVIGLIGGGE